MTYLESQFFILKGFHFLLALETDISIRIIIFGVLYSIGEGRINVPRGGDEDAQV